ncbi:TRAP-T family tripartite ATP-independent periplasmic membrane protein [Alkalihalophilus pseudofirmus OF4]|uniref:TRAP-T family tripartite ATP-independent periplasmic membrane protein n=1 Tax=Alkalihalophilus pseudofirmus (strain ATCC BAA-2126 / JCM 17055 / OF4) TaxID=398511 RepID=D3FQE2_ALKPO|nr:TRAP transporter large permease subunit [Alkalihalophilus pseudofirmus]ADC49614.1 TRAP-T family tripartite ATP-independent periplasmic membrane protein [Alkalihalophilus pseudofirmus OF4]
MGIVALIIFVSVLVFWSIKLRRNLGEAALVGFLAIVPLGGSEALSLFLQGISFASTFSVLYAAIAFVFMAYVIDKFGIVERLLAILNSLVGRLPGAPAIMDAVGSSVMGTLSGGDSGNTAATGSITGPWMLRNKWNKEIAASVMVGNGGMASALPPTTSMFIILGFAPVAAAITTGEFFFALLIAGAYQFLHRLILIGYFVKKQNIKAFSAESLDPLSVSFKNGWSSIFIYMGAIIPLTLTIGPLADFIANIPSLGEEALNSVDIVIWIPTLMIGIAFLLGRKTMPKSFTGLLEFTKNSIPRFTVIGSLIFFAVASSEVLTALGLSENISQLMNAANTPGWLTVLLLGLGITAIAGPLTSTGTLTAVGLVSYEILVSSGFSPLISAVVIMTFASTSAQMPPASGSIYIASGIVGARPEKTFLILILYYVCPVILIGWLIAMGILPV